MDQLEPPHLNQTPGPIMQAYGLYAHLTDSLKLGWGGRRDVEKFRVGVDHLHKVGIWEQENHQSASSRSMS